MAYNPVDEYMKTVKLHKERASILMLSAHELLYIAKLHLKELKEFESEVIALKDLLLELREVEKKLG